MIGHALARRVGSMLVLGGIVCGCAKGGGSVPRDGASEAGPDGGASRDDPGEDLDAGAHDAGAGVAFDTAFADPFVLRVGDRYHGYATNRRVDGAMAHMPHAVSTDRRNWRLVNDAMPTLAAWVDRALPSIWAPGVLAVSPSRYVLFYAAHVAGTASRHCVGRAVAMSPAGPFVDRSTAPLVCEGSTLWSLDPSPFRAPSGQLYLLWRQDRAEPDVMPTMNTVAIRELDPAGDDFAAGSTSTTLLSRRDDHWEFPIIENPSMYAAPDGNFYLFYSGNDWATANYAIGYAVCRTVLGPCTRRTVTTPWFATSERLAGPGGQDFFDDARGQTYMAWHAWEPGRVGSVRGARRALWIAPFDVVAGVPRVSLPP